MLKYVHTRLFRKVCSSSKLVKKKKKNEQCSHGFICSMAAGVHSCQSKQSSLSTSALISQQTLAAASSSQTAPHKWQQTISNLRDILESLQYNCTQCCIFQERKSYYKSLFCALKAFYFVGATLSGPAAISCNHSSDFCIRY